MQLYALCHCYGLGQKFKRVSLLFLVFQQILFVFSSCAYRIMFILMANSIQRTEMF